MMEDKYVRIAKLLEKVDKIAEERHDGHLSLLKFTTHWKVCYGTINTYNGGYEQVQGLIGFPNLEDALIDLLDTGTFAWVDSSIVHFDPRAKGDLKNA